MREGKVRDQEEEWVFKLFLSFLDNHAAYAGGNRRCYAKSSDFSRDPFLGTQPWGRSDPRGGRQKDHASPVRSQPYKSNRHCKLNRNGTYDSYIGLLYWRRRGYVVAARATAANCVARTSNTMLLSLKKKKKKDKKRGQRAKGELIPADPAECGRVTKLGGANIFLFNFLFEKFFTRPSLFS
jgi:hypothetical protein